MNFQSINGETPIIVAANYGYNKALEVLVNAGADMNKRDLRGFTALMNASLTDHRACVDLLLNAGADVNMCSVPEGANSNATCHRQCLHEVTVRCRSLCERTTS